ncbi:hypothetical protein NE237_024423 [Protea cynaroides]|uniref:J domain-containing protein n=1 Tax=Protea cynaroides TaxID=273540 RepID=A0A9Q0HEL7_9MAGN|nr:hypothetical protein NE237_024423 [Protea cynaroides]
MDHFSHTFHRNHGSAAFSKKISHGHGFTPKIIYDDVFGGPPKFGVPTFSSRIEDYSEIFGSFRSSRGSSIPVLDLPVPDTANISVDDRASKLDYSEIFGGLNGVDFFDSHEDLFGESNGGETSYEEAWTPAGRGSPSEGSSSDTLAYSENNQFMSDGVVNLKVDGVKQFKVTNHEAVQRSEEAGTNGTTHTAQHQYVSGVMFVVDESTPPQKTVVVHTSPLGVNDLSGTIDSSRGRVEEKNFKKTMSLPTTRSAHHQAVPGVMFVVNGSTPSQKTEVANTSPRGVNDVSGNMDTSKGTVEENNFKKSASLPTTHSAQHKTVAGDVFVVDGSTPQKTEVVNMSPRGVNDVSGNMDTSRGTVEENNFKKFASLPTTHGAQHQTVPGVVFVVDGSTPQKTEVVNTSPRGLDDVSGNMDSSRGTVEGKKIKKTMSLPPMITRTSGSDLKLQNSSHGNGFRSNDSFVTVSEISLRTQPSQVPPPMRPPPKVSIKKGNSKITSKKYGLEGGTGDNSPPFFDVEVDASSAAAASAAAMKEAVEKAEARIKSAKESMERKRDGLQSRLKLGLKDDSSNRARKEDIKAPHEAPRSTGDVLGTSEREGGGMKGFGRQEGRHDISTAQVAPDFEGREKRLNVGEEFVEQKVTKETKSAQESHIHEEAGEWKVEKQFYELATSKLKAAPEVLEQAKIEKKLVSPIITQKHEESERVPVKRVFEQGEENGKKSETSKGACEQENPRNLEKPKEVHELKKQEEKMKVAQEMRVCEGNEKKLKVAQEIYKHEEDEKKLKVACELEGDVKKLQEARELEKAKEAHELKKQEEKLKVAQEVRSVCEGNEKKLKVAQEISKHEEDEKKLKVACELEGDVKMLQETRDRKENEKKLEEAHEWEETEKRFREAYWREESERRSKYADEQEENGKKLKESCNREENEKRLKDSSEQEESEKKLKEACEWEFNGTRPQEVKEKEENDKRQKEACGGEENEKRLKEACEQEENKKLKVSCKREEENEKRLEDSSEKEENEKKLKEACEWEFNGRRLQEVHEEDEKDKGHKETCDGEENEKRLKEACKKEENEKRLQEVDEHEENEKRVKQAFELEVIERRLKDAHKQKESENRLGKVCKMEENEKEVKGVFELVENQKRREANEGENNENRQKQSCEGKENENKVKADQEAHDLKVDKNLMRVSGSCMPVNNNNIEANQEGPEHEENTRKLKMAQEAIEHEGSGRITESAEDACESEGNEKDLKIAKAGNEEDEIGRSRSANPVQCAPEQDRSVQIKVSLEDLSLEEHENKSGESEIAIALEQNEKNKRTLPVACEQEILGKSKVAFDQEAYQEKNEEAQGVKNCVEDGKRTEVARPVMSFEEKGNLPKIAQQVSKSQNIERKEKNYHETCSDVEREKEVRLQRERELEEERLRKIEEKEREREREKDRMAVERATREARERAFADVRERAERAAVERATAEVRQRAMAEARDKLEKASAEAREKSLAEKAFMEVRLKAERAAVERATAEARERAAEKAALDARERAGKSSDSAERSVADKFSGANSRDRGMRQSTSFCDLRDSQHQSSGSDHSSRYTNSSIHGASYTSVKFQGTEGESAQRRKARLERHQRTVERAAKALTEKNIRDLLAQREQAERNRLAETLDADVRRWSSGKEGNLRALLSTLQYILGPDSGWQPIPLTEVITAVAVKKAYRKATLCVHPDKLQQRGASIQQKYICEKVFDLLKEAWNKFNSEER